MHFSILFGQLNGVFRLLRTRRMQPGTCLEQIRQSRDVEDILRAHSEDLQSNSILSPQQLLQIRASIDRANHLLSIYTDEKNWSRNLEKCRVEFLRAFLEIKNRNSGIELGTKQLTNLEKCRVKLHAAVVPDRLPCRQEEQKVIANFIRQTVAVGKSRAIYVSGVPGTGKTASVKQVLREMEQEHKFRYLEVNAMKLHDPHQVFVDIYQRLHNTSTNRISPAMALRQLTEYFASATTNRLPVVLLLDEVCRKQLSCFEFTFTFSVGYALHQTGYSLSSIRLGYKE